MLSSEVLPAPFGPMTDTSPPRRTDNVMLSTARTPPKCFDTPEMVSCASAVETFKFSDTRPPAFPPAHFIRSCRALMAGILLTHARECNRLHNLRIRLNVVITRFYDKTCRRSGHVKRSARIYGDRMVNSVSEPETLPTTLLTGFLGSGKTTLLRRA